MKLIINVLTILFSIYKCNIPLNIVEEAEAIYGFEEKNWPLSCKGKKQSPINIEEPMTYAENLELDVKDIVYNLITTKPMKIIKGQIRLDAIIGTVKTRDPIYYHKTGIDFELKYQCTRIVFHSPSEHLLYDKRPDLEMQIECWLNGQNIYKYPNRSLVISYFFDAHNDKTDFVNLLKGFKFHSIGNNIEVENFRNLIKTKKFVIYEGSKTLPPCEDQTLHILNHKIYLIGREYINNIQSIFKNKFKMETFNGSRGKKNLENRPLVRNFEFLQNVEKTKFISSTLK